MNRPKFEVYEAQDGWRWRLLASNGRTLCTGEAHTRRRDALRAMKTVRETAVRASMPGRKIGKMKIDVTGTVDGGHLPN